jgi:hypothetical protein
MIRTRRSRGPAALAPAFFAALTGLIGLGPIVPTTLAQRPDTNYDEAKVGAYALPDPLVMADGRKVTTPDMWRNERRPELLRIFTTEVYGAAPEASRLIKPSYRVHSEDRAALGGKAVRREVTIAFTDRPDGPRIDLLIYLPKGAGLEHRAPAFLGLNFGGNHSVQPDPGITLSTQWMRNDPQNGITNHRATEATRGSAASRWPVERIIDGGYGLVTAYYGDIDPDYDDGFQNGVHPLFYHSGRTRPEPSEWGSIAAWAWGLSRALDYLETMPEIDAKKVVLMGHSRLGKTALWAGAQDQRFAIVISNNSGAGGAALSKRIFGETVSHLNTSFPHWFCANFHKFSGHEDQLPVDQHELIALIAPRPVLVCSAEEDLWADPKGEFLAARAADPVYRLLGTDGLAATEMPKPAVDSLINSTIGYRIRPGKHDVTLDDWIAYMKFADHHLGREGR